MDFTQLTSDFGTIDLGQMKKSNVDPLKTPQGTSYLSVLETPRKLQDAIGPSSPAAKSVMTNISDPSEVEEGKALAQKLDDEFNLEAMKEQAHLNTDMDAELWGKIYADPSLVFGTDYNIWDIDRLNMGGIIDQNLLEGYNRAKNWELARQEKLIHEHIPNYVGNEAGTIATNFDRDQLARKEKFVDKRAYWKRQYGTEARYFRIPTAINEKTKEATYTEFASLSKDGKVHRVDPSGVTSLTELGADTLDVTAHIANLRTGMTLGGMLFGGLLGGVMAVPGAYAGSYLGQIFDKMLADEGVDQFESTFKQRLLDKDAALLAGIDTALMFLPPPIARFIGAKLRGEKFALSSLAGTGTKEIAAQKAAQEIAKEAGFEEGTKQFDDVLLASVQLSPSRIWRGIFSQVGAISTKVGAKLSAQKQALFKALENKINRSAGEGSLAYDSLTRNELSSFISLAQTKAGETLNNLVSKNMNTLGRFLQRKEMPVKGNDGTYKTWFAKESTLSSQQLSSQLRTVKDALYNDVNKRFQVALNSKNAEGVYFDLTELQKIAQKIKTGIQTKVSKTVKTDDQESMLWKSESEKNIIKGTTKTVDQNKKITKITKELEDDLDTIINAKDGKIGNLTVIGADGAKTTFSGLQQLEVIRKRLGAMLRTVKDQPYVVESAKDLIEEIDKLIMNPKSSNAKFIQNEWKDAKNIYNQIKDVEDFSKLGVLFERRAMVNPAEYMQKFWNGEFGTNELRLFKNYLNMAKNTGDDQIIQYAKNMENGIEAGFLDWVAFNPKTGFKRLDNIMQDEDMLKLIVPDASNRKAVSQFYDEMQWLGDDHITNKIFKARDQARGNAKTLIDGANETEIFELIHAPPQRALTVAEKKLGFTETGINSRRANELRAAVFEKILSQAQALEKGSEIVNVSNLSKMLQDLTSFRGEFAHLKPLFVSSKSKLAPNNQINYTKELKSTNYLKDLQNVGNFVSFVLDSPDVGGAFSAGTVRSGLTGWSPTAQVQSGKTIFSANIWASVLSNPVSVRQLEYMAGINKIINPRNMRALSTVLSNAFQPYVIDTYEGIPDWINPKESIKEELKRTGKVIPEGVGPMSSLENITPSTLPLQSLTPAQNLASLNVPSPVPSGVSNVDYGLLFPGDTTGEAISKRKQGIMGLV